MAGLLTLQQLVWTPLAMADQGVVVGGAATITHHGTTLDVTTQTDRTIINWDQFNIPQGHAANFYQPGANSAVLNRVITTNNPSGIYGSLFSNGNVYLVNPAGIVVGPSGVINTNGFTASVLDISNKEFMKGGTLNFSGNSTAGILNQGQIHTGSGGATLIGAQVINEGLIVSQGGNVNLLTGGSVQVQGGGIYHQADQATIATGISETAGLIRNSGTLRATGALEIGGEVYLVSPGGTVIQEAIVQATKDNAGGNVVMDAGTGTATVTGKIDVNGTTGGQVAVTGQHVEVHGADIQASGTTGSGGQVHLGGGFQGKDASLANSQSTTVDAASTITANAGTSGNGGQVVLWSDGSTLFQGNISAQGSKLGEGGFVEISGKQDLRFEGDVNTGGGNLLLDPYNYTIGSTQASSITGALANNNVTIQTTSNNSSYGSSGNSAQNGDITVNSAIFWGSQNSLTLLAQGDIVFNATVQNWNATPHAGGNLNLVAGWDGTTSLLNSGTFDPFAATGSPVPATPEAYQTWLTAQVNSANPFFGNNTGDVIINAQSAFSGVAVGSANGETNVFANNLTLTGGNNQAAYAQLGYHHVLGGAAGSTITTGNINVGLTRGVDAFGGQANGASNTTSSYVQIGHGGNRNESGATTAWNYTGDITLATRGYIAFTASSSGGNYAYAQLGNGGFQADGNHSGNLTITTAQNVAFTGGAVGYYAYAQLGNGGVAADGNHTGDQTITAAQDIIFTGGSGHAAYAQFGNGGEGAHGNHQGDQTITAAQDITFTGGNGYAAYAQFGNGGALAYGSHSGDQTMTVTGDITFSGGSGNFTYAQLGNGGYNANGNHIGDQTITAARDITFTGGNSYAYAQLGNGGYYDVGNHAGNIRVAAENLTLQGGANTGSYAQIGLGDAANMSTGTRQGDISIVVSGETSLLNGTSGKWMIGHRSQDLNVISNADIVFLTGTLDYDASATSTQTLLNADFLNKMTPNLAGGNVTIGSTNLLSGATGGMLVQGGNSFNFSNTLSLLSTADIQFTGNVQNSGTGALNLVAGWNGQSGLDLVNAPFQTFNLFSINPDDMGDTAFSINPSDPDQLQPWLTALATGTGPTFFGNNNGSIFIGGASQSAGVAVGSANGRTNVFAQNLTLRGSDSAAAFAQLGFYHVSTSDGPDREAPGTTVTTGDINIGLTGKLTATGGSYSSGAGSSSFVQIGHGGDRGESGNHTAWNYTGNMTLATGGDITFTGGGGYHTYAQLGNGGMGASGDHGGTQTITAGGNITFQGGDGFVAYAQLGNGGVEADGSHSGNLTMTTAQNVAFTGGSGYAAYVQLGNGGAFAGGNHSGNQTITTARDITFTGGGDSAYAQIGNGGFQAYGNHAGDQTITATGDISFTGNGYFAYAQLGNGGYNADAANNAGHIGNQTITAAGDIKFQGGSDYYAYAQLGNGGAYADGDHIGDQTITAARDITFTGGSYDFAYAQLGNGGAYANGIHSGDQTITATGDITFTGGSYVAYAQLGNGGFQANGDHSGDQTITAAQDITFTSGNGYAAYAQLGNGGYQATGDHTGAQTITATGDITFTGGNSYAYAQIGNGGFNANGNHSGDIRLAAENLTLQGGTGSYAYAQIGHGDAVNSSSGTREGNISIVVSGETSLVNRAAPWMIGHRSTDLNAVSNADIVFLTGTLDYDAGSTSTQTLLNADFLNKMTPNLAGGNVTVGSTNLLSGATGGMLVQGGNSFNFSNTLSLLSAADIRFTGNVQNSGTGALNLVAGWNGQSGLDLVNNPFATFNPFTINPDDLGDTAFSIDPSDPDQLQPWLTSLATGTGPTFFGNNSGSIFLGGASQQTGVAVGSAKGDTNVFAQNLTLRGSDVSNKPAYAQLGYYHVSGGDDGSTITTGDINIGLTGTLTATAGAANTSNVLASRASYVQIGHGGNRYAYTTTAWNYTGNITLAAQGDVTFTSGGSYATYAQLGNGGFQAYGSHAGNQTITTAQDITFTGGGYYAYAQLGNGGYQAYGNHAGNQTITTAQDITFIGGNDYAAYAQLGNGGYSAGGNYSGNQTITAAGDIKFQGGSGYYAYAQLGNGGAYAGGNHGGKQTITTAQDITFTGGSYNYAYAQLGNGGYYANGDHSGDIRLTTGNLTLQGGTGSVATAQIGNGGIAANGNHTGDIRLAAENLTLQGGTGSIASAQIGNGDAVNGSSGTREGNISIIVSGETSLVNRTGPWMIGHRSTTTSAISNADIVFLTGTLDYDAGSTSTQTLLNADFLNKMTPNLAGGNVTVGSTNLLSGATGGMLVQGGNSFNYSNTLSLLSAADIRFTGNVQNSGTGALNLVAGWNGQSGLDLVNNPIATFNPFTINPDDLGDTAFSIDPSDPDQLQPWLTSLATGTGPTFFGNNSGSIFIGSETQTSGVAVGSANGQTNVFAQNLTLRGSDTNAAYAQLGYHHDGGGEAYGSTITTGDIAVGLIGDLTATGGSFNGSDSGTSSYVQIGHGGQRYGDNTTSTWNYTGNTTLAAQGSIIFTGGGSGSYAYAQLGNGGNNASGSHSGNQTIATTQDVKFIGGNGLYAYAQFGNGGAFNGSYSGGDQTGDQTVIAAQDITFTGGNRYAYAQFGNGGLSAVGNHSGNQTIATARDITFTGGGGDNAYVQFGNGGFDTRGNHSGTQKIITAQDITFKGRAYQAYAQFGNGGMYARGNNEGAQAIVAARDIGIIGGGYGAYAQLGNGGAFASGDQEGTQTITSARNISITVTGGYSAYAQLGNGGYSAEGNHSGDIHVTATGDLSLAGKNFSERYAFLGHGDQPGDDDTDSSVSGNIEVLVGGNITMTNAAIGHLIDPTGTYTAGNTYIAIGTSDKTAKLTADANSRFNSSSSGELRFYLPRQSSLALHDSTLVNGVLASDIRDTFGNLYNRQGNSSPFDGPYAIDATKGNYAFYLSTTGIWLVANSGSSTYGGTPVNPGISLDLNQGEDLNSGDSLNDLNVTTNFNLTATSDANTYQLTINTDNLNADYELLGTTAGTFTINPATLTFTLNPQTKTYGETFTFNGTEFSVSGLKNSEAITSLGLSSSGTDPLSNAGTYGIVAAGITGSGNGFNADNYSFTLPTLNNGFTVDKATLTFTPFDASKTYGDAYTFPAGSLQGLKNSDTATVTLSSQGAPETANAGSYDILGHASGYNTGNYNLLADATVGTFTVDKADLVITALDATKFAGQTIVLDEVHGFTASGLKLGQTIDSVTLTSPGTPDSALPGLYAITSSNPVGGTFDANNYSITPVKGTLTVNQAIPQANLGALAQDRFDRPRTYFNSIQSLFMTIQSGTIEITPSTEEKEQSGEEISPAEGIIPFDMRFSGL